MRVFILVLALCLGACTPPTTPAATAADTISDFRGLQVGQPHDVFVHGLRFHGIGITGEDSLDAPVCIGDFPPALNAERLFPLDNPAQSLGYVYTIDDVVRQIHFTPAYFNAEEIEYSELMRQFAERYEVHGRIYQSPTSSFERLEGYTPDGVYINMYRSINCGQARIVVTYQEQPVF